jgi:hypothetical protein
MEKESDRPPVAEKILDLGQSWEAFARTVPSPRRRGLRTLKLLGVLV